MSIFILINKPYKLWSKSLTIIWYIPFLELLPFNTNIIPFIELHKIHKKNNIVHIRIIDSTYYQKSISQHLQNHQKHILKKVGKIDCFWIKLYVLPTFLQYKNIPTTTIYLKTCKVYCFKDIYVKTYIWGLYHFTYLHIYIISLPHIYASSNLNF